MLLRSQVSTRSFENDHHAAKALTGALGLMTTLGGNICPAEPLCGVPGPLFGWPPLPDIFGGCCCCCCWPN